MIKRLLFIFLLFPVMLIDSKADQLIEKQIIYEAPFANEVFLVWGINNWHWIDESSRPPGTFINDNLMFTPMHKKKDKFVAAVNVPAGSKVDFCFYLTKGPFNTELDHWDVNSGGVEKDYHTSAHDNIAAYIVANPKLIKAPLNFSFLSFSKILLLVVFALLSVIFCVKRFLLKKNRFFKSRNPYLMIIAGATALSLVLIFIRASITGSFWLLFLDPLQVILPVFADFYYDGLVLTGLVLTSLLLLHLYRNKRRLRNLVLIVSVISSMVVLVSGIFNIKVIEYLGAPFNYRWLYYSGFLQSTDARNAIFANLDEDFLFETLFLILSTILLGALIYLGIELFQNRMRKISSTVFGSFLFIYLAGGYLFFPSTKPYSKTANPVVYCLSSFIWSDGLFTLDEESEKFSPIRSELDNSWEKKFKESGVENVLVYVLESTPAEFLGVYNPEWKVTPVLDSMAANSMIFENAYATTPSTNKSLVSLLCGIYPWLSYYSITYEHPGINITSLPSVLKRSDYQTAFFNSGDNKFNNTIGFLEHRDFDVITDYLNNGCENQLYFKDKDCKHCDGSSDECLSGSLFSWLDPRIERGDQKPFFATLWTYQTHYPYFVNGKEEYFSDNKEQNRYLNALKDCDRVLGDIIHGLKERELLEKTLIVILGDHGEAFGRHDQFTHASKVYEENLHIPLIFYNERLFNGERIKDIAGIQDIAPSVCAVLGKEIPEEWQGDVLFTENPNRNAYFFAPWSDHWFGIREGNYKYIYNASQGEHELYDLSRDPYEEKNLSEKHPETLKTLRRKLSAWVKYHNDFIEEKRR